MVHWQKTAPLYLLLLLVAVIRMWDFCRSETKHVPSSPVWNWVYLSGDVQREGLYKVWDGASIGETIMNSSHTKRNTPSVKPCWLTRPALTPYHWIFHAGQGNAPDIVHISRLPEQYCYLLGMPVDINRAEVRDLILLQGIGEVMARRIYSTRTEQRPFGKLEDLLMVEGIGPKTLSKLRGRIMIDPPQASSHSIVCD